MIAGQAVEVGDDAPVHLLVEAEEPGLVGEQLADGGPLLAGLGELRPVGGDPLVVVEPAARVGEGHGHGGHALRGREDEDHRVLLPRRAGRAVPDAAPQVDDLLAVPGRWQQARADLTAAAEVLDERLAHGLPARCDRPLDARPCPMLSWPSSSPRFRRGVRADGGDGPDGAHPGAQPAGAASIVGRTRWLIPAAVAGLPGPPVSRAARGPAARHGLHPVGGPELARDRVEVGLDGARPSRTAPPRSGCWTGRGRPGAGPRVSRAVSGSTRRRLRTRGARASRRRGLATAAPRSARASSEPTGRPARRRPGWRARGCAGSGLGELDLAELEPRPGQGGPDRAARPWPPTSAGRPPDLRLAQADGTRGVAARDRDGGQVGDRASDREQVAARPQVGQRRLVGLRGALDVARGRQGPRQQDGGVAAQGGLGLRRAAPPAGARARGAPGRSRSRRRPPGPPAASAEGQLGADRRVGDRRHRRDRPRARAPRRPAAAATPSVSPGEGEAPRVRRAELRVAADGLRRAARRASGAPCSARRR